MSERDKWDALLAELKALPAVTERDKRAVEIFLKGLSQEIAGESLLK